MPGPSFSSLSIADPFDPARFANHSAFCLYLGESFWLTAKRARQCIQDVLDATSGYAEQVMALKRVPAGQRNQLAEVVRTERQLLLTQL